MKKVLFFCLMAIVSILSFSSCNSIDEDFQGTYVFWVPYNQWGASMDEIKTFMKSQQGWKMNYEVDGSDITYTHKQTGMEVFYSLKKGGLHYVNLSYMNCEQDLNTLCNDWAKAFNFTWQKSMFAEIEALDCTASVGVLHSNGSARLQITLRHDN